MYASNSSVSRTRRFPKLPSEDSYNTEYNLIPPSIRRRSVPISDSSHTESSTIESSDIYNNTYQNHDNNLMNNINTHTLDVDDYSDDNVFESENHYDSFNELISNEDVDIIRFKKENVDFLEQINNLKSDIEILSNEKFETHRENNQLKNQIKEKNNEIAALNDQLHQKSVELDAQVRETEALKKSVTELELWIHKNGEENKMVVAEEFYEKIEQLELKLNNLEKEKSKWKKEEESMLIRINYLEKEYKDVVSECEKYESELHNSCNNQKSNDGVDELKKEISNVTKNYEENISNLNKKLEDADYKYQHLFEKYSELKDKKSSISPSLRQSCTSIFDSSMSVTTSNNGHVLKDLKQKIGTKLMKQKEFYENELANKDKIIQQLKDDFNSLNEELNDFINEISS